MKVLVNATEAEIREALAEAFPPEILSSLTIEAAENISDPLAPEPRRADPITIGILIWFASAVGGGVVYDLTKKAFTVLTVKFGHDRVSEHEDKG